MPLGCTLYCTVSQVSWCPRQSLKYHSPLRFSLHKHIPTDASTDKAAIGKSPTIPRRSSVTIPSYLGPEEQNSNTDQTLKYPTAMAECLFQKSSPTPLPLFQWMWESFSLYRQGSEAERSITEYDLEKRESQGAWSPNPVFQEPDRLWIMLLTDHPTAFELEHFC